MKNPLTVKVWHFMKHYGLVFHKFYKLIHLAFEIRYRVVKYVHFMHIRLSEPENIKRGKMSQVFQRQYVRM